MCETLRKGCRMRLWILRHFEAFLWDVLFRWFRWPAERTSLRHRALLWPDPKTWIDVALASFGLPETRAPTFLGGPGTSDLWFSGWSDSTFSIFFITADRWPRGWCHGNNPILRLICTCAFPATSWTFSSNLKNIANPSKSMTPTDSLAIFLLFAKIDLSGYPKRLVQLRSPTPILHLWRLAVLGSSRAASRTHRADCGSWLGHGTLVFVKIAGIAGSSCQKSCVWPTAVSWRRKTALTWEKRMGLNWLSWLNASGTSR